MSIQEPKVTLGPSLEDDVIVQFPEAANTRDNVWVTIHLGGGRPSASLNIIKTDEGIVLDLYPYKDEMSDSAASTYCFDDDLAPSSEVEL